MTDFRPHLPAFLRRTPEQVAADEAVQSEMRQALHGRVTRNAQERVVSRGIELEQSVLATLEHNQSDHMVSKLAEALAMQGKYDRAAVIEPSEEKTLEYQAIAEAIERDDSETCDCPQITIETDPQSRKEIRLPSQNVKAMIFSLRHQRLMPLIACEKCGDLQVASLDKFPALAQRMADIEDTHANSRKGIVPSGLR